MNTVRVAKDEMSNLLSELAYYSESYWGYDNDYMEKFKLYYNVTKEFINENLVFILEKDNSIIGFWGLHHVDNAGWELEYFYIAIQYINKGYGNQLWNSLIIECKKNQIHNFEFVTSPQAVQFYKKMGAETIGHVESLLEQGRMIPKLRYILDKQ